MLSYNLGVRYAKGDGGCQGRRAGSVVVPACSRGWSYASSAQLGLVLLLWVSPLGMQSVLFMVSLCS